jgi:branched-chain amino acid transport system ATP-binding protein
VSADPMLALDGLRSGYGETEVLSDVTLDVGEGEVVALVGRNGAGKTTTLKSIVGSLPPRGGTITYKGEDVTGLSPTETARLGIGLVPEERRVFPGLTVSENLRIGHYGGGDVAHRMTLEEVYDTFQNLDERRGSLGANLSGGEQQMLAIARALVTGADCLLLDEPTEGLAPLIVERVQELVRELNDDGITVLLVEQNVAVAMDLADRVFVLDGGTIVFEGTPAELEANPEIRDRHLGVKL